MTTASVVAIRPTRWDNVAERSFVIKSWLTVYRLSRQRGPLTGATYWDAYGRDIELLYERPVIVGLTTTLADDDDQFLGFLCGERRPDSDVPIVHFVYVKKFARREGVCKLLMNAFLGDTKQIVTTYKTRDAAYVTKGRFPSERLYFAHRPYQEKRK